MRLMFCALLICGATQASAQGTFLVKTNDKAGTVNPVQPLGQVNWMAKPLHLEGGVTMVASSRVRDVTTITFDEYGTAYAFFQTTGEPVRFLPISGRSMGAEGNFEYQGWPYVISQGRVMGINDAFVASSWRKLGDWRQKLAGARMWPATLWGGGAMGTQMVLSALFDWKIVATSAGAGVLGFLGKYGYDVRHDILKSHLELGYEINWFTKQLATSVEKYEIIEPEPATDSTVVDGKFVQGHGGMGGDVMLYVRKAGKIEKILMSQIVREQKVSYRHGNCIRLLEEIRGK